MSIFSHSSSKFMFSLKVLTISTAVFSMAVMLKQFFPVAISDLPSTLNVVASWLRPPYLYLVINCIIITIVATSKLQSKFDYYAFPSPPPPTKSAPVEYAAVYKSAPVDYAAAYSGGDVLKSDELAAPLFDFGYASNIVKVPELDLYGNVEGKFPEFSETDKTVSLKKSEEMTLVSRAFESNEKLVKAPRDYEAGDKYVKVLEASSKALVEKDPMTVTEFSRPPASARFSHRKVVKTTPEGGRTLRVSKPKRHDTLESTWKTITDGRPIPLTRHLRKSDNWEAHPGHHHHSHSTGTDLQDHHDNNDTTNRMIKSETFSDRTSNRKSSSLLGRSTGPGKLKKDPSLGQDELNKRVEAFINNFNQEMKLQREESMNQFMEMINRGAGP